MCMYKYIHTYCGRMKVSCQFMSGSVADNYSPALSIYHINPQWIIITLN